MKIEQAIGLVRGGQYVLKVKLGADPNGDGNQETMLDADLDRMRALGDALKNVAAPGSPSGRVLYYLDANGRYELKERIVRLLDGLARFGILDSTILLEEPFPETLKERVDDLPVRVVADESAHSDADVRERIELGYGAIALKPIAKTLSMSLRMARAAAERNVPCFCADLTVNPTLVEWNKVFAARLAPLPGMTIGLMETNGAQNYATWDAMRTYSPSCAYPWSQPVSGLFHLDELVLETSGCILNVGDRYSRLVDHRSPKA